jgi:hypothetical protein
MLRYKHWLLMVWCLVDLVACTMPNLGDKTAESTREICQRYVDGAAPFIGWEQGLGVTFAVATVVMLGIGAAVGNEEGSFWHKHQKALLLTAAGAFAILCGNFLSNAQSAADSAAQASLALALPKDDEMWAGCQRARALYFDSRAAGIVAIRDDVGKRVNPPTTVPVVASSTAGPPSVVQGLAGAPMSSRVNP